MTQIEAIAQAIAQRRCTLFAGAGVGRDAGLPGWADLGKLIVDRLEGQNHLSAPLAEAAHRLMELDDGIPQAIDLALSQAPRDALVRIVRDAVLRTEPSIVCEKLRAIPFNGIVTTNYDRLLDQFDNHAYRIDNSVARLKVAATAVASGRFIFKVHGDVDDVADPSDVAAAGRGDGFMVLGRSDYAALVQGERGQGILFAFHSILQQGGFLFLGYGLSDPNITRLLDLLAQTSHFPHPSWYVALKGQAIPRLPGNIASVQEFSTWDELPGWLTRLERAVRAELKAVSRDPRAAGSGVTVLSEERRRAFLAVSQYLNNLESQDEAERVLASALLEDLALTATFRPDWLSRKIGDLVEVGPALASALCGATIRYLVQVGLVERRDTALYAVRAVELERLRARAQADWQRDRDSFYASLRERTAAAGGEIARGDLDKVDVILQDLCASFGQGLAEWVHRGLGRDIAMVHLREVVARHVSNGDLTRQITLLLDLVMSQPDDREIPYLHRLLAAAFLANSVRLDPSASSTLRDAFDGYELYLDTNVLLLLAIDEHPDHLGMRDILTETQRAGASIFVLQQIFDEMIAHREVAERTVADCQGSIREIAQVVEVFGRHANCFLQGYLQSLPPEERGGDGSVTRASLPWNQYIERYSYQNLLRRLTALGVPIVKCPDDRSDGDYNQVLADISSEWQRKSGSFRRAEVLNENEAAQYVHIYHRRRDTESDGGRPLVWFLSFETVLAGVFNRDPAKWIHPPTFPFSAWAAFLDSRIVSRADNPRAVVGAILRGYSTSFDLPEPTSLVRRQAFGDRVTSIEEERGLQLAMSGFQLVTRVERATRAVLKRSDSTSARAYIKARDLAVGEVNASLGRRITELAEALSEAKRDRPAGGDDGGRPVSAGVKGPPKRRKQFKGSKKAR